MTWTSSVTVEASTTSLMLLRIWICTQQLPTNMGCKQVSILARRCWLLLEQLSFLHLRIQPRSRKEKFSKAFISRETSISPYTLYNTMYATRSTQSVFGVLYHQIQYFLYPTSLVTRAFASGVIARESLHPLLTHPDKHRAGIGPLSFKFDFCFERAAKVCRLYNTTSLYCRISERSSRLETTTWV